MKKNLTLIIAVVFISLNVRAQGVTIGANTPPDPSSVLDIQSSQAGVLLPRLTSNQRNAINAPAQGLLIFNTDDNCIQSYIGPQWINVACQCNILPDASFTASTINVSLNAPVNFSANTPGLNYNWTFNGGSPASSTIQSPSVSYANAGSFYAVLTVTDNNGCQASDSLLITAVNCPPLPLGLSQTFSFTGNQDVFTVPSCVTSINIDISGAEGGYSGGGGDGGRVQCTLPVTPGELLYIYIGGQGSQTGSSVGVAGGYNGGGSVPASSHTASFGSGGGASDIRRGGSTLNDRIIVAGGGGGSYSSSPGGAGGGLIGGTGDNACSAPGFGGTQNSGGAGGGANGCGCSFNPQIGNVGTFGFGGDAPGVCCFSAPPACSGGVIAAGGGGGGWYGGGSGGTYSAGGGGSSYTTITATNVVHTQGYKTGNGTLTINW